MAIALDAASNFNNSLGNPGGTNPATLTWSHTCTGTNLLLLVGVGVQGGSSANMLGVTYNGVAMTRLTTNGTLGLYYMIAPPTGAHNVVVSVDDTGSLPVGAMATSYTGVIQTGFPDSQAIPTASSVTTATFSTTVVATNSWLVAVATTTNNNAQLSASTGTTRRTSVFDNGNTASYVMGDSNSEVGTGSKSLLFTATGSANWQAIIVSIAGVPTATPSSVSAVSTIASLLLTIAVTSVSAAATASSPVASAVASTWTALAKSVAAAFTNLPKS